MLNPEELYPEVHMEDVLPSMRSEVLKMFRALRAQNPEPEGKKTVKAQIPIEILQTTEEDSEDEETDLQKSRGEPSSSGLPKMGALDAVNGVLNAALNSNTGADQEEDTTGRKENGRSKLEG
ncbi:hypothetical protein R1sor_014742 [Riccia sorocarpa]|uniref:Uncharacterized protein n=1 Tax=Riccia sorocarpa TaxID=122646 RepID=A0ABD3HAQ9_9MARC